ncbi:tripartite tricarboxylate transporter substrate binding protein [Achromobacter xylosoxidans]|uniref:Tripartite tricarboxylate transporter substrate binding protein n=1 Tax=Alcaligenes xylosoxydans xylosoxydans TaxID=85698 RepID=A0A424WA87_ALCXX|nr:tripartite tricarboxylate transporter substrate binding protein [Achromobacter xylosoxidans]
MSTAFTGADRGAMLSGVFAPSIKNRSRRLAVFHRVAGLAAALFIAAASPAAQAQATPVKIVVGFSPGGGVDTLARLLAQGLAQAIDRPVVVENRAGAGGTIAADVVARAEPDGATLLLADTSLLLAPHIYPKVNYRMNTSFTPVAMVGDAGLALAVPAASPARTLPDLLAMARKEPGRYTYASVGVGSMHHLGGELIKSMADVDLVHVPYKGGSPATQAVASDQVSSAISSLPAVIPQASAGRIRILAVLGAERFPGLPDVPTVAETLPGFDATPAIFLLAPAKTPPAALARITQALPQVLADAKLREAFIAQGSLVRYQPADALAAWLPAQEQRWVDLISRAKLTFAP